MGAGQHRWVADMFLGVAVACRLEALGVDQQLLQRSKIVTYAASDPLTGRHTWL